MTIVTLFLCVFSIRFFCNVRFYKFWSFEKLKGERCDKFGELRLSWNSTANRVRSKSWFILSTNLEHSAFKVPVFDFARFHWYNRQFKLASFLQQHLLHTETWQQIGNWNPSVPVEKLTMTQHLEWTGKLQIKIQTKSIPHPPIYVSKIEFAAFSSTKDVTNSLEKWAYAFLLIA